MCIAKIIATTVVLSCCQSGTVRAGDEIEELIANVLSAQNSVDVRIASGTLFRAVDARRVKVIRGNRNDGIALRAAWELALGEAGISSGRGKRRQDHAAAMNRFLGFVEGRLKVTVPNYWMKRVSSVAYRRGGLLTFPERYDGRDGFRMTPIGLEAATDIVASLRGGSVNILIDGHAVTTSLPRAYAAKWMEC